jgi:RNA polymerase sigma-70 factor (ECF subfamily)
MSLRFTTPAPRDACKAGEAPTFVAAFRAHGPYVWRLLRRLGVEAADADDLCQEVFVVLHRRWSDIDRTRPLRPWIYGVTVRIVSDHRRQPRHRETRIESSPAIALPPTQHDAMEERQTRDLLQNAILHLDEAKQAVFVLYELEEMPMPEIAEALACPLQTAYSRLHAARKEVKAFFLRHAARRETFA